MEITKAKHLYIFTERGYAKLIKIMDTDLAWEIHDKLMDEYLMMRDELQGKIPQNYIEALKAHLAAEEKALALESKIEEDKPYTDFEKAVEVSINAVKIEVFAKTLCNKYGKRLGRNKLFKLLQEHRVLFYENGQNVPFQDFINRGYFALKSTTFINKYGNQVTGFTTMITGKGQVYVTEKIDNWLREER